LSLHKNYETFGLKKNMYNISSISTQDSKIFNKTHSIIVISIVQRYKNYII
jgi:hypothetical protein